MKLFTRYNRINLLSTVIIFVLTSIIYYFVLRLVFVNQLDDDLRIEKAEIITYTKKFNRLPEIIPVKEQKIIIDAGNGSKQDRFETVIDYDDLDKENSEFRKIYFTFQMNGTWHQAMVAKSMEGTENLIQSIIMLTICTILLILAASLIINRLVLSKLWQPFYKSLLLIKDYKIGTGAAFPLPETRIEEFAFMNNILKQATLKADHDFLILKEFTENASHEMQTPLAIIRSKLDLLIQDEAVSEKQGNNLEVLYEATQKLTRLNKSLLLLTKIENNQFSETSEINLAERIKDKLSQFREILISKQITVNTDLKDVTVNMNNDLIDLLLNNLISNSIKHNVTSGSIAISLDNQKRLLISNTGSDMSLNQDLLFTRFYKEKQNNDDTGLGLSIVKQICMTSSCTVHYQFIQGIHSFSVEFR